jgi:hypothetical protein
MSGVRSRTKYFTRTLTAQAVRRSGVVANAGSEGPTLKVVAKRALSGGVVGQAPRDARYRESSSGRPGCPRKRMTQAADHRAPEGNVTNDEILAKWRQRRGRITMSTRWSCAAGEDVRPPGQGEVARAARTARRRSAGVRVTVVVGWSVFVSAQGVLHTQPFSPPRKVVVPGVIPVAYGVRPGQTRGQK